MVEWLVPRCLVLLLTTAAPAFPALAQSIVADLSAGTEVDLDNNVYSIDQGTLVGTNLFHSFQKFGLENGEVADFSSAYSAAVENIIGRVTGGMHSHIAGVIKSSLPGTSLYLFNPNGFSFAPGSRLDVQGSFYISSGSQLQFMDGTTYSTDISKNAGFTAAAPERFGFAGSVAGSISLTDTLLAVPPEKMLGLYAGEVSISGAGAGLLAPAGHIEVSTQTNGTDPVQAGAISIGNGGSIATSTGLDQKAGKISVTGGLITLSDASEINASGPNGAVRITAHSLNLSEGGRILSERNNLGDNGHIAITSDKVLARGAPGNTFTGISTSTIGAAKAGEIDLNVQNLRVIRGAMVKANSIGPGGGGTIRIHAGEIVLDADGVEKLREERGTKITGILTSANVGGNSGNVEIVAKSLRVLNDSEIRTSSFGTGHSGDISIRTGELALLGETDIDGFGIASTNQGIGGRAGDVQITAKDIEIRRGGFIFVDTASGGRGGNLSIDTDRLFISADGNTIVTGLSASSRLPNTKPGPAGAAGQVSIHAKAIEIRNGGIVRSLTFRSGDAGKINVVSDSMLISGDGAPIDLPRSILTGLTAVTTGSGNGGEIVLDVDHLEIRDGGQIRTTTTNAGDAGNITIQAERIFIGGPTEEEFYGIFASATETSRGSNRGRGGNIDIRSEVIQLQNGGVISADTSNGKRGGDIKIETSELTIESDFRPDSTEPKVTAVTASTRRPSGRAGPGGSITIDAGRITLLRGGQIRGVTFRAGNAGMVTVEADEIRIAAKGVASRPGVNLTGIAGTTTGNGAGSSINVQVGHLDIESGGKISVAASARGNAGSIEITAKSISIDGESAGQDSGIFSDALRRNSGARGGRGGDISIAAQDIVLKNGGAISSDTKNGRRGGNVVIVAPNLTILGDGRGFTGVTASAEGRFDSPGNAGRVEIAAHHIIVRNGSLSSSTTGTGNGGRLDVFTDLLEVSALGEVVAAASDTGDGGSITLHANNIILSEGATLSASSSGTGEAGAIRLLDLSRIFMDNSVIKTSTSQSEGGAISIQGGTMLALFNSQITTSVADGKGGGGNILLNPLFMISGQGKIIANAVGGNGGNIIINADYLFVDAATNIEASSQLGIDGTIEIDAPDTDVTAGLVTIEGNLLSDADSLAGSCGIRNTTLKARFSARSSGGIALAPDTPQIQPIAATYRSDENANTVADIHGAPTPATGRHHDRRRIVVSSLASLCFQ